MKKNSSLLTMRLESLIADAQAGFASGERDPDGIIQVRMNNVTTEGRLEFNTVLRIPLSQKNIDKYYLAKGDVLFNCTNSPSLVGKTALFRGHSEPIVFSNHFVRLRVHTEKLDSGYLARWLTEQRNRGIFEGMCTQWVNQASVRKEHLLALEIPLLPLPEQRRIAAILDKADAMRELRRQSIAKLDTLLKAVFLEMFGDPMRNPKEWATAQLGEVAEITSGAMKGRKFNGQATVLMPYLRVANVQDGFIDLREVKEIEVLATDIERYRLQPGDVLMTEGGDPDKLGRGAIWRGEIPNCLHQNHIFRVRTNHRYLFPEFLSGLIGSERGKRYFLREAKQTTGIATINMTQLREFPVLLPPIELQQQYLKFVEILQSLAIKVTRSAEKHEELFRAIQQRAFTGKLLTEKAASAAQQELFAD